MAHGALMVSVPFYAAIAHLVFLPMPDRPSSAFVSGLFWIAGLITIPAVFVLPARLAKSGVKIRMVDGMITITFDPPSGKIFVGDLLCESIAVYGLAGSTVGMPAWRIDALMVISFVLLSIQAIRMRNQMQ